MALNLPRRMSQTKRRVSVILTRIAEKAVANVVLSVGPCLVWSPFCLRSKLFVVWLNVKQTAGNLTL